jgi:nucleoside-diphosphate-sugar epimerase
LAAIRNNPKRIVENLVISQAPSSIKTALIVGPLIYGVGRGLIKQRSIQAPEIARATLELGHGFKLNDGKNIWSNIHVHDLASLVSLLVEAAKDDKDGFWNEDGIYNVENGELVSFRIGIVDDVLTGKAFGELSALVTKEAYKQGFIEANNDLETIDAAKADSLSAHASLLWGTNARTRSTIAQKNLGWKPTEASLEATIPDLVHREGTALNSER